jgi:hypothetical protein
MCKQYFRSDYCGNVARPNQSLKLTEVAVDDLTRAKQTVTCWTGHTTRGMDSVAAALRCRSLAPVR